MVDLYIPEDTAQVNDENFVRRSTRKSTPATRYDPTMARTPSRQPRTPGRQTTAQTPGRQTAQRTPARTPGHQADPQGDRSPARPGVSPARQSRRIATPGKAQPRTPSRARKTEEEEKAMPVWSFDPKKMRIADPEKVIKEMSEAGYEVYKKLQDFERWNACIDEYIDTAPELQPANYQEVASQQAARERIKAKIKGLLEKYKIFENEPDEK